MTPAGHRLAPANATRGVARTKLPVVVPTGSAEPRPRREYNPQLTPAIPISVAPRGSGAESPGDTRYTSPAIAAASPAHSSCDGRSPARSAAAIIVACTQPKRISAPVPVLSVV